MIRQVVCNKSSRMHTTIVRPRHEEEKDIVWNQSVGVTRRFQTASAIYELTTLPLMPAPSPLATNSVSSPALDEVEIMSVYVGSALSFYLIPGRQHPRKMRAVRRKSDWLAAASETGTL
jgi:hypothetical protein